MTASPGTSTAPTRGGASGEDDDRLLRIASMVSPVVALLLIALKAWGWQATTSVALLASLADSLLDLVASVITFLAIRLALTPPDDRHRFGHGKSEALAGVVQASLIIVSAMFVVYEAMARLVQPAALVQAPATGVAIMVLSVLLTVALVLFQRWAARRTGSLALAADSAHYRSDLILSLLVIAGTLGGAMPAWRLADPAVGLAAAAWLVHVASGLFREAMRDLLDEELPVPERERLVTLIRTHPQVRGVHDLRSRSSGRQRFAQVHVELDPDLTLQRAHEISDEIEAKVMAAFERMEVLIHLDPAGGSRRRPARR